MDTRLLHAQSRKSVWVGQHLTPLPGQRGESAGALLLLSSADLKHLLGFLPGWRATQGGQAKGDAPRILALAYPVLLGHAAKRCDRIGTDRQAEVVEPQRRGGLELGLERARQLAAHRPRRDRVDKRLALRQRVGREPLGCEKLLACQQRDGIVSEAREQRLARGQLVEAGAQWREGGARLRTGQSITVVCCGMAR